MLLHNLQFSFKCGSVSRYSSKILQRQLEMVMTVTTISLDNLLLPACISGAYTQCPTSTCSLPMLGKDLVIKPHFSVLHAD